MRHFDKDQPASEETEAALSRRQMLGSLAGAASYAALSGSPLAAATKPSAIWQMEALPLSRAIKAKQISCVEVMSAFLERIDAANPRINAIVALQPREILLAQAKEKDAAIAAGRYDGWLHGIPFAVKDLTAVKGIRQTNGSLLYKDRIATEDAAMVAKLRAAGCIFIGKTNTPEFGMGSHTYNPVYGITRNPYDQKVSAGGSSGGAAAAISARMLPVADGSDIGGSLRNPAAWNNIYGLRPSAGRIIGSGGSFAIGMGVAGPMARSVPDLAMLLATQSGPTTLAPLTIDENPATLANPTPLPLKGVRIGWLGNFGSLPMEPGVLELCRAALKVFEDQGAIVEPVTVDASVEQMWQDWMNVRAANNASSYGGIYRDPAKRALIKPEAVWEIEKGLSLSAMDMAKAEQGRMRWYRAFAGLFDRYSFLVCPSAQIFPFPAEQHWPTEIAGQKMDSYHRWMEITAAITFTDCPALAAPAGFNAAGLPIGFQIVAPRQKERDLLRIGLAYDLATRWPEKRPPA